MLANHEGRVPVGRFIAELKRRNVLRIAGLYLAGAWLLLQVLGTVLPFFDAPLWIARTLTIVLAVGFVPTLVLAWVFEWTAQGVRRDDGAATTAASSPQSGKRIDRLIMVVLALAIGYFAFDKFVLAPQRQATVTAEARREGRSDAIKDTFGERSIAVLPFADMSQRHDQQYLSDGIADELLNMLARVRELRVISRSSAFQFRERKQSIPEIARKLEVGYILDGSIRKAGNRVRITVQLIDGRSDTQLWNDTYDRPLDDIFAIQDEISAAVVAQLQIKLLTAGAPSTRKTSPEAYDLYLRALAIPLQADADYESQIKLLMQVVAIDPKYVPAWDALATLYAMRSDFGYVPAEEGYPLAQAAANKALAIDPTNSQALAILSSMALRRGDDIAKAARLMQNALAADMHDLNNLNIAEDIAKSLGRMREAVEIDEYIIARDPMEAIGFSQLGIAYQQAGRLDASIEASRRALALEPGQPVTQFIIATSCLLKGDAKTAQAEIGKEPFEPFRLFGEAMIEHTLGNRAKSDAALAELVAKYDKDAAYNIAYVEAWRGNVDSAFAWLDKAVDYKDSGLPMIVVEPLFRNLHADPRWAALLQRLGKSPEQLARIEFKVDLPDSPGAVAPSR